MAHQRPRPGRVIRAEHRGELPRPAGRWFNADFIRSASQKRPETEVTEEWLRRVSLALRQMGECSDGFGVIA